MAKRILVVCVLGVFTLGQGPRLLAQASCDAHIKQLEASLDRFGEAAHEQGLSFARTDAADMALRGLEKRFAGKPTTNALKDLKEKHDKFNDYVEYMKNARTTLDDLAECIAQGGRVCSLLDFAKRQNDAIKKWIESLNQESLTVAAERVHKASELIRGLVDNSFSMAEKGALAGIEACKVDFEQRATNTTAHGGGGHGPVTTAVATGLLAAGGFIAWDAKRTADETDDILAGLSVPTPTATPVSNNTPVNNPTPTGVRAFDGTYDMVITVTGPGGTNTPRRLSRYLVISNGSVTTTARDLSGSVDQSGGFIAVGACPINNDPADFQGRILSNGTGSGTYRCRTGGISRDWLVDSKRMNYGMSVRDVLIVGAGPSGLATAIACKHFGLDYAVIEQGALVDAIARFPINMVFFTTPELLEIGGIPLTTPFDKPTRAEALRYYRKVVDTFQLQVSMFEKVVVIEPPKEPGEPFVVESESPRGVRRVREARNVVLAMGYYESPNMLNVPGEDLPHVSHFYTEAHPFYRRRVVIVGGKNSAAEAALEIHRAGGHVTMVHRGPGFGESVKYWVKPDIQNRVNEGSIAAHFNANVVEIRHNEVVLDTGATVPAEAVLLLTGYRADPEFMRRIGVKIHDETLAPKYNIDTYETDVPGLFVAGGQVAGKRTGTVFIENGRFHGEQIAKAIAGRSQ